MAQQQITEGTGLTWRTKLNAMFTELYAAITGRYTKTETDALVSALETSLKAGVSIDGDTLNKLRGLISNANTAIAAHGTQLAAIQTLLTSDDVSLDTLQEIVAYIKNNQADITALLSGKLDKTAKATEAQANAETVDTVYITPFRLGTWFTNLCARVATFTNKTISGANNTFSDIPQSAVTGLTTDLTARVSNSTDGYTATAKVNYIITLSQTEYDAIVTKDVNTLYIII